MSKQSISQDDDWLFNIPLSSDRSQAFEKDLIDFESELDPHSNSANAGRSDFSLLDFSPPTTPSLNIPAVATSQSNAEPDDTDESSESTSDSDSIIEVDLDTLRLLQAKINAKKASSMGPSGQRGTTVPSVAFDSRIPTYEGGLNYTNAPSNMAYNEFETLSKLEKYASSAKGHATRSKPPLMSLPIESYKDEIVQMVRSSQVIVLSGSTGCGKSTQVPQYILDDCLSRREYVNIICTQPRRIAATSIAHRVATERRSRLGDQIGYHIGGHIGYVEDRTRLRYVTTGILLEILKGDRYLERYSHVIMDEIHERNVDDDLMMAHMCMIMQKNHKLKLVVMSATLNVFKFAEYFSYFTPDLASPLSTFQYSDPFAVPTINIPSRCFPVDTFYLEDVCDGLELDETQRSIVLSESRRPGMYAERRDAMLGWIELCHLTQPPGNAFLVFLPGIAVIAEVVSFIFLSELLACNIFEFFMKLALTDGKTPPPRMHTIKLHSTVTIDEQALAMRPAPAGSRKVRKLLLYPH
ncbi:hypothetical protein BC937DRAFT_88224 [Endogone sp. FLAS-F59071]|nr:hypothetical protein BC937DRAFT_88224 [Endogone sp. FLAS-F59071]|eukprot:RUS22618.1 hypothetical protein BC937DRAFT_88224 [Endogone sp. FLAS-F59071]